MKSVDTIQLSRAARIFVLLAAVCGLVFDGFELGLMPVASLSVSKSLLGDGYTKELGEIGLLASPRP